MDKKKFYVGQEIAAQNRNFSGPENYKRLVKITRINGAGNLKIGRFDGVTPGSVKHGSYFSDDPADIEEARKCGDKYNSVVKKDSKHLAGSLRRRAEDMMRKAQEMLNHANELERMIENKKSKAQIDGKADQKHQA